MQLVHWSVVALCSVKYAVGLRSTSYTDKTWSQLWQNTNLADSTFSTSSDWNSNYSTNSTDYCCCQTAERLPFRRPRDPWQYGRLREFGRATGRAYSNNDTRLQTRERRKYHHQHSFNHSAVYLDTNKPRRFIGWNYLHMLWVRRIRCWRDHRFCLVGCLSVFSWCKCSIDAKMRFVFDQDGNKECGTIYTAFRKDWISINKCVHIANKLAVKLEGNYLFC